jgi:hypothetical protein
MYYLPVYAAKLNVSGSGQLVSEVVKLLPTKLYDRFDTPLLGVDTSSKGQVSQSGGI